MVRLGKGAESFGVLRNTQTLTNPPHSTYHTLHIISYHFLTPLFSTFDLCFTHVTNTHHYNQHALSTHLLANKHTHTAHNQN
jgi:hypothetical protein